MNIEELIKRARQEVIADDLERFRYGEINAYPRSNASTLLMALANALEAKNQEANLLREAMKYRSEVISGYNNCDPGIAEEHSAIAMDILRDLRDVDYEMGYNG